jgi:hypothetical protein
MNDKRAESMKINEFRATSMKINEKRAKKSRNLISSY